MHRLSRLSKYLGGPDIYIKRDDQSGLATGGNKCRKLEFLIGDALARGCDAVITGGAAQSNHCRQTAAAAAQSGLQCHLMLGGEAPERADGNLLLDHLLGAQLHWCGPNRKGEDIPALARKLTKQGGKPYIIPYGGSNALGALGFVSAAKELKWQLQDSATPISHIIFASSSGGTHAGLHVGARLCGLNAQIYGVAIDKSGGGELPLREEIIRLCKEVRQLLGEQAHIGENIILDDHFIGAGYGVIGPLEREAIRLLGQTEGVLLDPVYTGRAFGAMVTLIARGAFRKTDSLLFWHTGGTPALYPYAEELG